MIEAEVNGIGISISEDSLNDWDILEGFLELDETKSILALGKVAKLFYGEHQWAGIRKALREQNGGKLPINVTTEFIVNSFKAVSGNGDSLKN